MLNASILLVNSVGIERKRLSLLLASEGHTVRLEASNLSEVDRAANSGLQAGEIDVAIVSDRVSREWDKRHPCADGQEAAAIIKKVNPKVKVVALMSQSGVDGGFGDAVVLNREGDCFENLLAAIARF